MPALVFKGKNLNISFADDAITFYPVFQYYEGDSEHKLRNCLSVIEDCHGIQFVIKRLPDKVSTTENEKFIQALEAIHKKNVTTPEKSKKMTVQDGATTTISTSGEEENEEDELPSESFKQTKQTDDELSPDSYTLKSQSKNIFDYDKFVRRNDDDHMLYHRDSFILDESHWHIKFTCLLNIDQLVEILNIFIKHQLLTKHEQTKFLEAVEKRYSDARIVLSNTLTTEKEADAKTIIAFIKKCPDNDILKNLHGYLTAKVFDYLRSEPITDQNDSSATERKKYQGSDSNGQIVATSREWSLIEKAITLQMAHNIQNHCTRFTPALGKQYAKRLKHQFCFFSISRNAKHGVKKKSSAYLAIKNADAETIEGKLERL